MKPDQITIINKRNNEKITFDAYVNGPQGILLQNFDPGKIPVSFNSIKGVNQVGETKQSVDIEVRTLTLGGAIISDEGQTIVDQYKSVLDQLCNPQDDVLINISKNGKSREIVGSSDGTVVYSVDYRTSNSNILSFKLSFECFNPYFKDVTENNLKIETWIDSLEFLEIIEGGIEFGTQGLKQIEVTNLGDVEAPLEIFFYGPGLNPKITLNNDKFIKINKEILDGEILYIYSDDSEIKVEIQKGSTVESGYNYIDIDSDFFMLEQGSNLIAYDTEGESISQSVLIKYNNFYFSL